MIHCFPATDTGRAMVFARRFSKTLMRCSATTSGYHETRDPVVEVASPWNGHTWDRPALEVIESMEGFRTACPDTVCPCGFAVPDPPSAYVSQIYRYTLEGEREADRDALPPGAMIEARWLEHEYGEHAYWIMTPCGPWIVGGAWWPVEGTAPDLTSPRPKYFEAHGVTLVLSFGVLKVLS